MSRKNRKNRKPQPTPYVRKALAAFAAGKIPRGQVTEVLVMHDDWCDLLKGRGPCSCNPDVRFVPAAGGVVSDEEEEAIAEAEAAQGGPGTAAARDGRVHRLRALRGHDHAPGDGRTS